MNQRINNDVTDCICPACKGKSIKSVETIKDNGICGPGYRKIVMDIYYSCKDCGVRFDKI